MEYVLDYARIGQRISELRKERNLSQYQLAELINVTYPYISHIETARKKPSLESLVRIATVLGVTLDRILLGNQVTYISDYLPEILSQMEDCSQYEKAVIYDMVKSTKTTLRNNSSLIPKSDRTN